MPIDTDLIEQELADWIDTEVIAEHILEELEDNGIEPSVENAQKVWLDVLETELCQAIRASIEAKLQQGILITK